jgi:hypothetical protein
MLYDDTYMTREENIVESGVKHHQKNTTNTTKQRDVY